MASEDDYRKTLHEEESNAMEATSIAMKRRRPVPEKLDHRHRAQSIIQSKALDELETEVFETGLYENTDFVRGSEIGVMAAEIIYSYLWWSVFGALPALIWFYPLCAMEISGYESLAFLWLSPLLTFIGPIRRGVSTPTGLMLLRILTLIGVVSFQAPTTLSRLILLAVGNSFALLTLCASWWNMSKLDRHRHIYLHMLGYLLFLAIRVWGSSFNYIFMSQTYNTIAAVIGLTLVVFLYINDERTPVLGEPSKGIQDDSRYPGQLATGMGFGALMFLCQLLYGEVSVISRWAVVPYPDKGPYPYPWGLVTMLALSAGLVFFGHQKDLITSHAWTVVGLIFSMVLYFMQSYTAFFGGIVLGIYTMSLFPLLAKRMVNFPTAKVLSISMATFIFYTLLAAWVVAYNFVPGGTLTRERTDVMLIMLILMVGLGTRVIKHECANSKSDKYRRGALKGFAKNNKRVTYLGRMFRRLSTISEENEDDWAETTRGTRTHQARAIEVNIAEEREGQRFHEKVIKAAAIIFVLALLGFATRYHPNPSPPVKEHPKMFSAGIWAFHFGYDNDAFPSMERAAQLIKNTDVDVIGLLETDAARPYIGNHDIATWLEERLNVYVDYGPGTNHHTWGCLVLSKYPILKSKHYLLPSPDGEIAPAILATVNVSGNIVDFYIVHFGNDVDELDRKLQAEMTAEILANSTNPIVMLSYITNPPGSRDYWKIVKDGQVKDIDPNDKKRWCEYVFYRGVIKLGYARVSHGGLSDTEVQIGKFRIQDYPDEPDNLVVTTNPSDVLEWVHFPTMFGSLFHGHYRDESRHHYHMSTPKYFKQS